MAALAAAALEPQGAERDVELVVDDDEPLDRHLVEVAAAPATGPPDSFMYDSGLGEHDPRRRRPGRAGPRRTSARGRLVRRNRPPTRAASSSSDQAADVVPVAGVRRARVAEPDDEPTGATHGVTAVRASGVVLGQRIGSAGASPSSALSPPSAASPRRPRRRLLALDAGLGLGLGQLGLELPRRSAAAGR